MSCKRIGIYTLKIYEENVNIENIPECCIQVTENMDVIKTLEVLKKKRDIDGRCEKCRGCPAYCY